MLGCCLLETFCFDTEIQNHYYARPMRDGPAIDSIAFARDADELRATLAVGDLPRLQDMLFDQSGEISYHLAGAVDQQGVASLRLHVSANLVMTCQRCLGPLDFSLDATRKFELVPETQSLGDPAEEPGDVDRIPATAKLDVVALVEEETILCLPMVALHNAAECSSPLAEVERTDKQSPFSSLSTLKRQ